MDSSTGASSSEGTARGRPMGRDSAKDRQFFGTSDKSSVEHVDVSAELHKLAQERAQNSTALSRIATAAEERNELNFFLKFPDTPEAKEFFSAHGKMLLNRMQVRNQQVVEEPQPQFNPMPHEHTGAQTADVEVALVSGMEGSFQIS